jgi:hypothetical protein
MLIPHFLQIHRSRDHSDGKTLEIGAAVNCCSGDCPLQGKHHQFVEKGSAKPSVQNE